MEAKIVENVRKYGTPRDIRPIDALEQELHRTQGHVDWLDEQVGLRGADPHLMAVYQAERAHLTKVTQLMMQLDVPGKRIELSERTLDTLQQAIEGIVLDLGHDMASDHIRRIIGRNLEKAVKAAHDDRLTVDVPPEPVVRPEDAPGRVAF